ncbi:hypothetical protein FUT87_27970 [Mitsuaria sp. TWR114]|nr:hypothetical protein FUT87_27970 [Mitsuaria sp. TWR114]
MGAPDLRPFRHLNEDGLWPRFHWHGLARGDDGALRLAALPALEGELPAALGTLADAQPQGGVAVDAGGTVFFTDPAGGVVSWIEGCFGAIGPVPCLGGPGSDATRFDAPAGLAIAPARGALYVADAGNHRVEVFDLGSLALVEVLEGFQLPVSLALDEAGQLYVADLGRRSGRVHHDVGRPGTCLRRRGAGQRAGGSSVRDRVVGRTAVGAGRPDASGHRVHAAGRADGERSHRHRRRHRAGGVRRFAVHRRSGAAADRGLVARSGRVLLPRRRCRGL